MYDKSLIDEISKKADIVTVIGRYLNLIKKGKIYVAICPFHNDTNPSLQVDPNRNTFHCWVDGHSGNAISFVMQYEHLPFNMAIKKVAEIIGFVDPRLNTQNYVKKIDENLLPLIKCIDDVNFYYEYALNSNEGLEAKKYLKNRKIDNEAIKKFHIGYSLSEGTNIINFLKSKGHSLKTIEDIGIINNVSGLMSDINHGRITFPLFDSNGQVVGFSARTIKDENPKYINSRETKLFIKNRVLYNFHNVREIARNVRYVYLLEGFMDVIALSKIHIESAVALMGVALSKYHIELLKKLNVEVRLCLDGDLPGQEASMRALPLLLKNKIPVRIVNNLNNPSDPDEILKSEGEESLIKYLNNLLSPFDFVINFYKNSKPLETIEDKKKLIAEFLPLLIATTSKLEFDDYVFKLSEVTGFSSSAIIKSVKENREKIKNNEQLEVDPSKIISTFHPERKELRRLEKAEREILYHMLNHDDAIHFFETNIEVFYTKIYSDIANFLLEYRSRNEKVDVNGIITDIEASDIKNKEKLKEELNLLTSETNHLKFTTNLLKNCKDTIEEEKRNIFKKQMIADAIEGKSEEEKARVIADILRTDN